jgi:hypothetical protein
VLVCALCMLCADCGERRHTGRKANIT